MPAAGTDGPPTPTAGALGGKGGATGHGGGAGTPRGLPTAGDAGGPAGMPASDSDAVETPRGPLTAGDAGEPAAIPVSGNGASDPPRGAPTAGAVDEARDKFKSSAVIGRGRGGLSRFTPWSRNQARASPPTVALSTHCVASIMLDMAVAPTWSAMAFDCAMTAFTAVTFASIESLPARIWSIC